MFFFHPRTLLGITLLFFVNSVAKSDEPERSETIKAIKNAWERKQLHINTIECSGVRESLFLKGGYTGVLSSMGIVKPEPCPPKDLSFSNEPFKFVIDFVNLRIRRETEYTTPLFTQGVANVPFNKGLYVDLVTNGEYRSFFSTANEVPKKAKDWNVRICPNVLPFISFESLPILWSAGGVSGQLPGPTTLKSFDKIDLWNYKGVSVVDGKECVIITMPEQKSYGTLVREFALLAKDPFLVVSCTVRNSKGAIPWKLDVSYKEQGGEQLPDMIKFVDFIYPSKEIRSEVKIKFNEFYVNRSIPEAVFDKTLEPGMKITYPGHPGKFEVDESLAIVPRKIVTPYSNIRLIRISVIIATFFCFVLFFTTRYLRRRKSPRLSTP